MKLRILLIPVVFASLQALPLADWETGISTGLDARGSLDDATVTIANGRITDISKNGVSVSLDTLSDYRLAYGVYGRIWMGDLFKFVPVIKLEVSRGVKKTDVALDAEGKPVGARFSFDSYKNLQYGFLGGIHFPIIGLVPYIGASFSKFLGDTAFKDTIAFNYGIKWSIPLVPLLTVGLDGSFQRPETGSDNARVDLNRVQFTMGLEI